MTTASSTYGAVLRAEVLRNARRPAPYVMALLFIGNAVLWWFAGPANVRGWVTDSDFYLARLFTGFSFMTLPICTAIIMGDPVLRDFTERVDPLLFSKPLRRAAYVLGKFSGTFLVLMLCHATFALAIVGFALVKHTGRVDPVRLIDYARHFLFFVVATNVAVAAMHFTVGTLTRSSKAVYALAVCTYPLYIAYQLQLVSLPPRWRVALDPFLMNWSGEIARGRSADWLNALIVSYDGTLIANRAVMIVFAALLLTLACLAFDPTREPAVSPRAARAPSFGRADAVEWGLLLPSALRARFDGLMASVVVETRLMLAERSVIVLLPVGVAATVLGPMVYGVRRNGVSQSAAYAFETSSTLLLVLVGFVVFYVGEAMHRDRERRAEALVWATPVSNWTILLAKLLAVLALAMTLIVASGVAAVAVESLQTHALPRGGAYVKALLVIDAPTAALAASVTMMLNVLLRDKHAAYIAAAATALGLFYTYGAGHSHWSYNPALVGLWTAADLDAGGGRWFFLVAHRVYTIAWAAVCLAIAFRSFPRVRSVGAG